MEDEEQLVCVDPGYSAAPAPEPLQSVQPPIVGPMPSTTPVAPTATPAANGMGGVEFCERPADIPVIGAGGLGVGHWWLRTPNVEAGMGPDNGTVPGEARSADYPGMGTTINDHTGRGAREGSTCVPVEQHSGFPVDQACIERELALGTDTGRWVPPFNDCHTTVDDILARCRVWGDASDDATDPNPAYRYDGGVPGGMPIGGAPPN